MVDILPYIVMYTFLFSLLFVERIKGIENVHKKYVMLFTVVIFTLFRGLRWEVGTDWEQFHDVFYLLDWGNLFSFDRYGNSHFLEPGYSLLNLLVRTFIYEDYSAFLIVMNLIILAISYNCAWKYFPKNPINIFVCILLFEIYFPNRHGFACAIVFFSYRYILTQEFIKFTITIMVAVSVHSTSFLVLPFYFLLNKQFSFKLLFGIYCVCVYIGFSSFITGVIEFATTIIAGIIGIDSSLLLKVVTYTQVESISFNERNFKTLFLMFTKTFCFMYLFFIFKNKFKDNGFYNIFYNCFFIQTFIATIFKFQMQDVLRMQLFFSYGMFILLGIALGQMPFVKNKLFLCLLFLYTIYSHTSNVLMKTVPELFIPYRTIFGG